MERKTMYNIGHINPFWTDEYKHLDFAMKSYNNLDDINIWRVKGLVHKEIVGGELFSLFEEGKLPWADKFFKLFGGKNSSINFFKMNSGDILPYHHDTYKRFREIHNLKETDTVYRALVFLEDRKEGHIFEVDGKLLDWKAGDFAMWENDTRHLAANIGTEPRYTVQITFTNV